MLSIRNFSRGRSCVPWDFPGDATWRQGTQPKDMISGGIRTLDHSFLRLMPYHYATAWKICKKVALRRNRVVLSRIEVVPDVM